jgi:hypothetical protein
MTEHEWLASVNTRAMIAAVRGKGSDRLWRLFAVACVRGAGDRLRDGRSRKALEVAERFADGTATRTQLRTARALAQAAADQAHRDEWEDEFRAKFCLDAAYLATCAATLAAEAALRCVAEDIDVGLIPEGYLLPDLLREVFGNPFQ